VMRCFELVARFGYKVVGAAIVEQAG